MRKKAVHGSGSMEALEQVLAGHASRDSVISADVLDSWYGPSPLVLERIRSNLDFLVSSSPPTHGDGLRNSIAKARNINSESILIGSGTSSLMFLAIPRIVESGDLVSVLDPMYGEYRHLCEQVIGAKVQSIDLDLDSLEFSKQELLSATRLSKVVFIVNPNSPTGQAISRDEFIGILKSIGAETWIWVDETYVDFFSLESEKNQSLEDLVYEFPRLIISKSMSKFYSLSGLRVGYLVANPEIVDELDAFSPPWSVGTLATVAAETALLDKTYYFKMAMETRKLRESLASELASCEAVQKVFSSCANFLLCKLNTDADKLVAKLAKNGIYVRDCGSLSSRFENDTIRITVMDSDANRKVVSAIRSYSLSS